MGVVFLAICNTHANVTAQSLTALTTKSLQFSVVKTSLIMHRLLPHLRLDYASSQTRCDLDSDSEQWHYRNHRVLFDPEHLAAGSQSATFNS